MAEEHSKAREERDWLEAHRREIEEDASRQAAQALQEGQSMLVAACEKLHGDMSRFEE